MRDTRPVRVSARRRLTCSFLMLLAAAAATSCSRGGAPGGAPGGGAGGGGAAVVVTVAAVIQKPMAIESRTVGNVEASSSVDVRAQVSGELLKVGFQEGQDVAAGQVLFTINPRQFEVALQQAAAALARSTAQAKGTAAQVARAEQLLAQGLLPRSEREQLVTLLAVNEASIASDAAAVENAKLQLQYTTIIAPVAGRTGALLVHPGALIRANDATPLVIINQVSPAYVSFAVPARLLPQLRREQAAGSLRVMASPAGGAADTAATGTLTFVDNAVDQATDTIRLKATFPNRDRRLWAGAFVDVILRLSVNQNAVVVPNAAVQVSQQGQYVYVVKADETVEMRPIRVAWTTGDDVVIETGVAVGETVVTDGQLRLTPGSRVSVKPADQQARTTP